MIHDSNKAHTGSLTGLTVELSIPGSCLEFGPFSADCSPKAPQNTRREGDTSLCAHQIHAVASKTAGKPRQTSRSCEAAWRNTFSPAARQKNTPLWFSLRVKRTQSREWEITRGKNRKKRIPTLVRSISTVDAYIQPRVVVRIADVKEKRKAVFWNLPIPVEKLWCRAPRRCCWGNLCCAGSPQRSVSTQQRYAGGGTTGVPGTWSPRGCLWLLHVCTSQDKFSRNV